VADIIRLDHVTKRFGAAQAVDGVSFRAGPGETLVLIGPSGCGKTTTLKTINRLVEPDAGTISVRGHDVRTLDPVVLRRSVGYVIQQVGLFPHMTVEANVTIVLRLLGWDPARRRARAGDLLDLVGLSAVEFLGRYPRQLSGGQQQRVGVARALAADPDIVLMDEPFGAVDPITRKQLQRELRRIQGEVRKTIVFVTHDLAEAFRLADRIVVMDRGVVRQDGTPRELLFSPKDEFITRFVGDDRGLRALEFLSVGELMTTGDPARLSPMPADAPSVFSDESVVAAIRRLGRDAKGSDPEAERIGVRDRTGALVGQLEPRQLLQAVGEALSADSGTG
jgi:osmoprotectant transport system ATP-binding protein